MLLQCRFLSPHFPVSLLFFLLVFLFPCPCCHLATSPSPAPPPFHSRSPPCFSPFFSSYFSLSPSFCPFYSSTRPSSSPPLHLCIPPSLALFSSGQGGESQADYSGSLIWLTHQGIALYFAGRLQGWRATGLGLWVHREEGGHRRGNRMVLGG